MIPKETEGIVQRLVINTDNNTFKIDINSASKSGSIFKSDNHLLYDTPKDMADEFKQEFGELLPKNFDYIKNLAVYDYIYYSYKKRNGD